MRVSPLQTPAHAY